MAVINGVSSYSPSFDIIKAKEPTATKTAEASTTVTPTETVQDTTTTPPPAVNSSQTPTKAAETPPAPVVYTALANANASTIRGSNLDIIS